MPNLDYVCGKIVAAGAIEKLDLAQTLHNSLQDRVAKILPFFFALRDEHFPDNLREDLETLISVYTHPISPGIAGPPDDVGRRCRSLTRNEAKGVRRAFLRISVEVTRQLGREEAERIGHRTETQ